MQGIRNIRCQSCGCDYFKTKGKNVRFFWYIVGAVVGVLLLLFMLGSAMGCDLCIECAEACDMDELADCGRDCDEETDACVAANCQGTTCGEKQGCGRCEEKWDCSSCGGYIEYTVTIVLDEYNETSFKVDQREQSISEIEYIQPQYIPGKGSDYYQFLGYFDKNGKQYFDDTGNRLRAMKGSMTLYADYEEKALGEEYTLVFNTEKESEYGSGEWFPAPASLSVVVGDYASGMPGAPELPGYTFKGWYNTKGNLVVGPNSLDDWEFHLYSVEHSPENPNKTIVLDAKYVQNEYDVVFHYENGSTAVHTVTYGTILQNIWEEYDMSNNNQDYNFFGWAKTNTDSIEEVIDPYASLIITDDIHVYEVKRDWVTLYFYYDKQGMNALTYEKKFYEGQTCVFSELLYRDSLQCEDSTSTLTLNEWVADASLHPGYTFNEAWSVGRTSSSTQESIVVSSYETTFYASLSETTYRIKYMVDVSGNGILKNMTGYAQSEGFVTNYKYGEAHTIDLWNCQNYLATGVTFEGWYIQSNGQNVDGQLNSNEYGDIVLVSRVSR